MALLEDLAEITRLGMDYWSWGREADLRLAADTIDGRRRYTVLKRKADPQTDQRRHRLETVSPAGPVLQKSHCNLCLLHQQEPGRFRSSFGHFCPVFGLEISQVGVIWG